MPTEYSASSGSPASAERRYVTATVSTTTATRPTEATRISRRPGLGGAGMAYTWMSSRPELTTWSRARSEDGPGTTPPSSEAEPAKPIRISRNSTSSWPTGTVQRYSGARRRPAPTAAITAITRKAWVTQLLVVSSGVRQSDARAVASAE